MKLPQILGGRRSRLFFRLIVNGLLQAAAAVGFAWLARHVFDTYLVSRSGQMLQMWLSGSGLLLLSAIIGVLRRQERVDAEMMGQTYVREVRKRLFARVLNSQQRSRDRIRKGLVINRFATDLSAVRQWVSRGVSRLAVAGVSLAVVFVALAWLHWGFALIVGSTVLLTVAVLWLRAPRLRAAMQEARKRQAFLSANMAEKVTHVPVVQMFDQVAEEKRYLARQNRKLLKAAESKAAAMGELRAVVEIGAGMAFAGALLMAAYAVQNGSVSAGGFVAVLSLLGFLVAPLRDVGRANEYWLAYGVATEKLQAMARRLRPLKRDDRMPGEHIRRGDIRLEKVFVEGALDELSLQIEAGRRVVLVGENGSGKSTLLSLLVRLMDPDAGQVMIDGVAVDRLSLAELRRKVVLVSPELPLLRGTLFDNLTYGLESFQEARLASVLDQCGMSAFVNALPEGMLTRLTEDGGNLSQGERARVHIARALLREPKVLLLDEADAYLDAPTVQAIDRIIEQFQGTVLIATHRRDLAARADQIVHLHQGVLQAQGDAGKLLSEAGPTRQLFNPHMTLVG